MNSFTSYHLHKQSFPEGLPPFLIVLVKALSTLAKFVLPLVLESIYNNMENGNFSSDFSSVSLQEESLLSILVKITISLSCSYFLELYCEYLMTDYRLNIKKELTKRIIENNIRMYSRFKQEGVFYLTESTIKDNQANKGSQSPMNDSQLKTSEQKQEVPRFCEDRLSLWTDISSKMPVYVYNYHASLLGIIFQSLNIVCVCVYLFIKLSYSLFFGLVLALLIMSKIINVTKKIQTKFFDNIRLRERKLALLKHFFNHLVEYKMTWLDRWIYDKIAETQKEYQQNLEEIKYLDVWCVGLWRFTSISISSVVVIAFYFMGIKATETITPSTLIQFLMILTMPLNALAWQIAGLRNSIRSINQLKFQVSPLVDKQQDPNTVNQNFKISEIQSLLLQSKKRITIKFSDSEHQVIYEFSWDIRIEQGSFIEVRGKKQAQNFLSVLPFYLKNNSPGVAEVGYVEENAWQIQNILESIAFKDNQKLTCKDDSFPTLEELLEVFDCHDIPQFRTITSKNLSGGQKMRINLVRAFYNSKVVVINSDLSSVDVKMRVEILKGIHYLADKYCYTVFCRSVELQDQKIPKEQQTQKLVCLSFFSQSSDSNASQEKQRMIKVNFSSKDSVHSDKGLTKQKALKPQIKVDERLHEKLRNSLKAQITRYEETEISEDPEKSLCRNSCQDKNNSNDNNLKWQTFTTYYKSKYHVVFLVGIVLTTFFQHFYQYYLNNYVRIGHVHEGSGLTLDNVKYVAILTGVFAAVLFVRSYYFAVANVSESKRIAKQLDQNIIMNQMEFYENLALPEDQSCSQNKQSQKQEPKEEGNEKNAESSTEDSKGLGNKLIYHSTSDLAELSDRYPWQANILFNDIATTTSSVLIIFSEIPLIGLILVPIIAFTVFMNNQYQIESQRLLKVQKKVEQNLMKTVHQIEEGVKYIYLHGKVREFKGCAYRLVDKQINIEWRLSELKRVLNTKYKLMMIVFLVVIIFSYGTLGLYTVEERDKMPYSTYIHINENDRNIRENEFSKYLHEEWGMCHQGQQQLKWGGRNKSGKFAMVINYTIILANFMLYLIIRLGQTCTPALSIERVRPILCEGNSRQSQERIQDFERVLAKISNARSMLVQVPEENQMISITNLDFSYKPPAQSKSNVFEGLSLQLRRGERIQIRGKSGNGKTTLYKLLCSLYKKSLNTIECPFHLSFSPQHPLILPDTHTVSENIDPYHIYQPQKGESSMKDGLGPDLIQFITSEFKRKSEAQNLEKVQSRMKEARELLGKSVDGLSYRQKIMVNNVRAWLYGRQGVKIYDQPYWVDESYEETYVLTTHQREFRHSRELWLEGKTLVQK